ncbi:MAG: hypothetical protein QF860_12080 [Planctomycetota bacterium]|nr:hypothetical protein [Planctomycetota bacterium]
MPVASEALSSAGVWVNRSLFLLSLRRALRGGWLVAALALVCALWVADSPSGGLELGAENGPRIERGLERRAMWTAVCLLVVPALVIAAAREAAMRREGGAAWLTSSAAPQRVVLASTWSGLCAAAGVGVLGLSAAAELAAGAAGATALRSAGNLPIEADEGAVRADGLHWRSPAPADLPPRSRARLELSTWSRGGPATEITLKVEREGGGEGTILEDRLARAAIVELDLPPGEGDFLFTLVRRGGGAAVVLEPAALSLLVPAASERLASVALASRLLLALAAWCALGLGLGAWMSARGAVAVLAGAQALVWLSAGPSGSWLPAADWAEALSWVGEGIVPPPPTAAAWLGTGAWVLFGLGLARLGAACGWSRA